MPVHAAILHARRSAILDATSLHRAILQDAAGIAVDEAVSQLDADGCVVACDEPFAFDRRGALLPSPLVCGLLERGGLAVKRYDAGAKGSVVVVALIDPCKAERPPPLCCNAEHFRAAASGRGPPRWNALQALPSADVAAAASPCPLCAFQVPARSLWRCSACQAVCCTSCMPAATAAVHDLSAALLNADPGHAVAAPDLGQWPSFGDSGRVPIWWCWTGDNPLPAYLSLCMESFARHAAPGGRFTARLVRARDVESLLGGEVHPAYEHLSLVHRADYLRCELLHRHGGLYCDVDTICCTDLSAPLHALRSHSAVLSAPSLLFALGMNAGLFRRDSPFTRSWRRALHRRLDARLDALREFRAANADPREDALGWDEILRDLVVPLSCALAQLRPNDLAFSLRAHHWCPDEAQAPYTPQGFDPLSPGSPAAGGVERPPPPEGADLVVLNNNQYSASFKAATREEVLASACTLSGWLARAIDT